MSIPDLTSATRLLELVHRFYPANLHEDDPRHKQSEENQRLVEVRAAAWDKRHVWKQCLSHLRAGLPQCQVEDWTILQSDSCWRVRVYLPGTIPVEGGGQEFRAVVGLVSLLAPVSAIYTSFHQRMGDFWRPSALFYEPRPETQDVAGVVESTLSSALGITRLAHEILFTPVHDIQCFNVPRGKAHLIDCLFTDDRW